MPPPSTPHVSVQVGNLIRSLDGERTRSEIPKRLGLKVRKHLRTQYVQPALADGLMEMTIPDKPSSSEQKCRLTGKGRELQSCRIV